VLEIRDMVCGYGNVTALRGISLQVKTGQLVALIGANGAGKSTTLRAISGLVAPRSGTMLFEGKDIAGAKPPRVVASGIAHCPEGRRVFPHMTVEENLDMGAYLRSSAAEIAADRARIYAEFPRLAERRKQAAGTLSGGEQQMLAIGRALMSRPRLIMFDEPSLGLAPNIVERTFAIIRGIRDAGTTVLLVEQQRMAPEPAADPGDGRRRDAKLAGDLAEARAGLEPQQDWREQVGPPHPVRGAKRLVGEAPATAAAQVALDSIRRALALEEADAFEAPGLPVPQVKGTGRIGTERGRLGGRRMGHGGRLAHAWDETQLRGHNQGIQRGAAFRPPLRIAGAVRGIQRQLRYWLLIAPHVLFSTFEGVHPLTPFAETVRFPPLESGCSTPSASRYEELTVAKQIDCSSPPQVSPGVPAPVTENV